jgi:HK97 family phage major capsid protein
MDLTRAKDIAKKIEQLSRTGSLELYNEANEKRVSVSVLLEEMDPTPHDQSGKQEWPLDAFERQLMLFGIRSGEYNSITVQELFDGRGMILAPEWVRRQIIRGMQLYADADDLVAVSTKVNGPSFQPLYIESPTEAGKSLAKFGQGASMPRVTILYRDKTISLNDYGRAFDFSYKVIQHSDLSELKVVLWYVGYNIQSDKVGAVYNLIVDGDGAVGPSHSVKAETAGYTNLTYDDLVELFVSFRPFKMTRIIVNTKVEAVILKLTEFKNPDAGFSFQRTGDVMTPLGAKIVVYTGASDDYIAALDHRFAVKRGYNQELMIEHDKIIDRKIEQAAVSQELGYSVFLEDARKFLDMSQQT